MNSRHRLISRDAETGLPAASFGDNGTIALNTGLRWKWIPSNTPTLRRRWFTKILVIVGNGVASFGVQERSSRRRSCVSCSNGQVSVDISYRTRPGEFGADTWGDGSAEFTGHTNVWAPMSLDESRGLLYLPVSTPSNDFYGGRRPGANLFADSLFCLDANTGERKWHTNWCTTACGLRHASPPNLVHHQCEWIETRRRCAVDQDGLSSTFSIA